MKLLKSEQWLFLAHVFVSRYVLKYRKKSLHEFMVRACEPSEPWGLSAELTNSEITILCVKWDEIGDMATCLPAIRLLKASYPQSRVILFCKPFVKSFVEPEVCIDEIYTDLSVLPKFKPDLWIEFRGTFYSLFRALISGCKVVLTRGYVRYLQRGNQLHERITNVRILSPVLSGLWADFSANEQFNLRLTPFALTQTSPEIKKTTQIRLMELFAGKLQDDQLPRFALIHPGGRSLLRRWKPENFMEIERYLFEKYGIHSVVLGSQEEFDLVQQIAVQPFANPWISTDSLHVLLEMIQRAVLFIGNESGPLQIADLTETPAVGLFGPGVPNVFYPFNPRSKVLHYILDCNPCDQITCVRPQDRCVDRISVMEVKNSIDSILKGRFF